MILNLVELVSDEESAFDQECKFGHRVGGHAVYCHNDRSMWRKCPFGWRSGGEEPDNKCPVFEKNPNWKKDKS